MHLIRRSRVGAWAVLLAMGCLVALLALPVSAFAQEEVLYGCAGEDSEDSELYIIDPTTGAATLVGSMGGEIYCTGLAFSADGTLFAMAWDEIPPPEGWIAALYTVNPNTGAATMIGHSHHAFGDWAIPDISFRSDGTLFGYLKKDHGLGTINTATAAVAELGATGLDGRGNGIAFDAADVLFHADDSALNTLDQTDGHATWVTDLTFPDLADCPVIEEESDARINALDFNSGGTLFGSLNCGDSRSGPNYLVRVNTTTGKVREIGPTVDGLDGIAFWQPPPVEEEFVPEWGSIALLGSGLAGLAGYASLRWRKS